MRIQRFFLWGLLALLSFVWTVSCSSSPPESAGSTGTGPKVALITSGPADDNSWSEAGIAGLKLIETRYNAQTSYQASVSKDAAEEALRQYAKDGYEFIIAHSGGYVMAAEKVAAEFPRTKFMVVNTYPGNNKNLGAVAFRSGEVGYLTGYLAAMKSRSQKVGYIVGDRYPMYVEEEALFRRGAQAQNPKVEVSTVFLGSWTDGAKCTEIAQEMVAQGVDVLALNADAAGVTAMKAIAAQQPDLLFIGWTQDQHAIAPDHVITSVLQDIPALVFKAATLMLQGRWEGKLYKFGLKEQIYGFAPFRGSLSAEEEATFNQLKEQVIVGEIDVAPEASRQAQ